MSGAVRPSSRERDRPTFRRGAASRLNGPADVAELANRSESRAQQAEREAAVLRAELAQANRELTRTRGMLTRARKSRDAAQSRLRLLRAQQTAKAKVPFTLGELHAWWLNQPPDVLGELVDGTREVSAE